MGLKFWGFRGLEFRGLRFVGLGVQGLEFKGLRFRVQAVRNMRAGIVRLSYKAL